MRGHEYARGTIRDHLAANVPVRLSAIRTALSTLTPSSPTAYLLADALPTDPALYPCVVVMSTGAPAMKRQSVRAAGDSVDYVVIYSLRIVVACRTDQAAGEELASLDRDRLLLAVREALLSPSNLPPDVSLMAQDMTEETGAAAQDLRGRPLAAGQITCQVGVLETLAAIPVPDAVAQSEISLTGQPSGTADITPN